MNRPLAIAGAAALLLTAAAPFAQANDRHVQMSISIGIPGFYAPPVYFAPPPPPVVYYPAPYYAYYHHRHRHDEDDEDEDGDRGHGYYNGDYRGDNGWRRVDGQELRRERVKTEQIRYRERD